MSDPHFYSLSGPLDSMPSERQMRTANLSSFAELVRQYGADPRSILEQHGIDPRALRDPDFYIDCKSLVDVFEYCSTNFNDRSEERRAGTACVSTCRSRWSTYH